ncbi:MAG TPA: cation-translocating P-type ATPase [Sphingobacteriaceae bacterium]
MKWYLRDSDEVISLMDSSRNGLTQQAVEDRIEIYGLNKLEDKKKKPVWLLFLDQFKDFMILVLIAAAIISGFMGDVTDAIIILIIVLLNAVLGFVQQYRAEKAMLALKKMAGSHSRVIRDGSTVDIVTSELVPGDIVELESGNVVPADLRLIEAHALRVEESSLTGESVPVDKTTEKLSQKDIPLGDQLNMAFKSTLVANGRGVGIVVDTGMNTEIGRIASLLQEDEAATPLQQRMTDFGKKLSYLILVICIVLFVTGLFRGEKPVDMLLIAISLGVAAIPEALPALITISLARGAKRLVRQNALIRKLPAVETLGAVSFICTDKTGTLTENKMKVVEVRPFAGAQKINEKLTLLDCAMAINHDVKQTPEGKWVGDPTEVAMVEYVAGHFNNDVIGQLQAALPRVAELPFDSDRKCMTTIHQFNGQFIVVSKGAAETIASLLDDQEVAASILNETADLSAKGIRVLAFGYRLLQHIAEPVNFDQIEKELSFAGLTGMIDPPREEAKKAIETCRSAGIKPVMITGDHQETAMAIARQLGILRENDLALSGPELQSMTRNELSEKIERISVYARVSPEQKLTIVRMLQSKNHFVAMTGDGVNDAPSLRAANIGVAMGISGTDVSKQAAHMILLDDNFATIVGAVKEGRRIYDNIRKFVKYIMTCNGAEIWTIFLAPFLGLPMPLLPIHILWINLVTDGLPGLALSSEKAEGDIMTRPPRKAGESLFAEGVGIHIVWVGLLMAAVTLGTQVYALSSDKAHWQTMVFTVLSLSQLGHVFAIRSDYESIFKKGVFTNLPLLGAIVFTFLLQLGVIYLPFANKIFKTQPLSVSELGVCVLLATVVFHAVELEKWIKRRNMAFKTSQSNKNK